MAVFVPTPKDDAESSLSVQTEALALLEQDAAMYDKQNMTMRGETEGKESSLSNLKAKNQQGLDSNLSNLVYDSIVLILEYIEIGGERSTKHPDQPPVK